MAPLLIIDPGHGGIDPGGGTNKQFKEKDLVLQISLYQQRRLQELTVPVALTRTSDQTLDSEQRAALVRNSGARYCISNHINAGGGRGAELIYSIYGNAAFPKALTDDLEAAGMPVRRIFTRAYPNNPKQDYYFMHRETGSVETIIIEYGFADNPIDADKLEQDWTELAESVVRGFCDYVKLPYTPPVPEPPVGTDWKQDAVKWLYEEGLLTDDQWRTQPDQPLPLWAEAIVIRRLYEKLKG